METLRDSVTRLRREIDKALDEKTANALHGTIDLVLRHIDRLAVQIHGDPEHEREGLTSRLAAVEDGVGKLLGAMDKLTLALLGDGTENHPGLRDRVQALERRAKFTDRVLTVLGTALAGVFVKAVVELFGK